MYSQSRVGVVGSQLFRAAGDTETGFSNLFSIACYKQPGNHLSKRVRVLASGGPTHISVPARVLIWTVSA